MTLSEIQTKILNGEIDSLTESEKDRYRYELYETETESVATDILKKLKLFKQGEIITF